MSVYKKDINKAIEEQKESIDDMVVKHKGGYNGMIPVVYVAKVSARKYAVGWNFAKDGVKVGDIEPYDNGCVNGIDSEVVYVY